MGAVVQQNDRRTLQRLVRTSLDLRRPVPPGMVIGVLVPEEDFDRLMAESDLPYPPLADRSPGCSFNSVTRELSSRVWGKVRFDDQGLCVEPSWNMSRDKTLLTLAVDHVDCAGREVTVERLLAEIPPGLEEIELDEEELAEGIARAAKSGKPQDLVLARGQFPLPGEDGRLELTFSPHLAAGTLREDGSMDFRERGGLNFVTEDERLAVLVPPVPGMPGHDILGESIPPPEPKPAMVHVGKGVMETPEEDGRVIYTAAHPGIVHFQGKTLSVSNVLEINGDVDMSTGNVHSKHGAVHVKGCVRSGFKVEAPGDIVVDDVVEEADLIAGGNVAVGGGVIMNRKTRIVAKGNVSARFMQNARVAAGGDLTVEAELSHCEVKVRGKVMAAGSKGMISGGRVECGDGVQVNLLGNEARSKTVIVLDVPIPEAEEIMEERNLLAQRLVRLDRAIGSEDALGALMNAAEEDRRILAELIKVRGKIQADIRAMDDDLAERRRKMEAELAEKRVHVLQTAYSGVEVFLGNKRLALTEDMDAPVFRWDPKERAVVAE
ncbi:DUF342 domain-containing protein [Desulfocurvus sp. DL9XJH121]